MKYEVRVITVSSDPSREVILSGTPAGVGPIAKSDVMQVSVEGLGSMSIPVV